METRDTMKKRAILLMIGILLLMPACMAFGSGASLQSVLLQAEQAAKEKAPSTGATAFEDSAGITILDPSRPAAGPPATTRPTAAPTQRPTPTTAPTKAPTQRPTPAPTSVPTKAPTATPKPAPTIEPTATPQPTKAQAPAATQTTKPTAPVTASPTVSPTPAVADQAAPASPTSLLAFLDEIAPTPSPEPEEILEIEDPPFPTDNEPTKTLGAYQVSILGERYEKDATGNACIIVTFEWSHQQIEPECFLFSLKCSAFQGGVELATTAGVESVDYAKQMEYIPAGVTDVQEKAFILRDDRAFVEVTACETWDFYENGQAKQTFALPIPEAAEPSAH